jgi:putative aldouronate transport system substrate-binding protein
MKIIRLLIYTLSLLLFFFILSACNSTTELSAEEKKLIPKESLKEVVLKFIFMGEKSRYTDLVLQEVNKKVQNAINASLDFQWYNPQEYSTKIQTLKASNDEFDAFVCGKPEPYIISFDYREMARKGELADITEIFPKTAPELYKMYAKEELEASKIRGKLYVVPSLKPYAFSTNVMVKKEFLTRYNIKSIKTLDEYSAFLKIMKENEPNLIPGTVGWVTTEMFARLFGYVVLDSDQRLVYKWKDPDMKVLAWEQTPEFRKVADYIVSWLKDGYLVRATEQYSINEICSFVTATDTSNQEESVPIEFSDGNNKETVEFFRCHLYPRNKTQKLPPVDSIYMKSAIVFNAASRNTDRALMFLDWVQSNAENYDLFINGIEGKHYKINKGTIEYPKENSYVGWLGSNAFQNIKYEHPIKNINKDYLNEYINFIKDETEYPPHTGFYPDFTLVADEAKTRSQFYTVRVEQSLSNGTYSLEDTDMVIENFKTGADKIVKEVQLQLDVWRKDKNNK